jgi:hypothetical protein
VYVSVPPNTESGTEYDPYNTPKQRSQLSSLSAANSAIYKPAIVDLYTKNWLNSQFVSRNVETCPGDSVHIQELS